MAVDLDDLWLAYEMQSQLHDGWGEPGAGAWLDLEKGVLIVYSGDGVIDDETPPPDDIDDNPRYVPIPTRQELDLGRELALDFMAEHRPDEVQWALDTLRRRGGWHRFKDHLEDIGLIREWFDYQERRTNEALKAWCEAQGVDVTEKK